MIKTPSVFPLLDSMNRTAKRNPKPIKRNAQKYLVVDASKKRRVITQTTFMPTAAEVLEYINVNNAIYGPGTDMHIEDPGQVLVFRSRLFGRLLSKKDWRTETMDPSAKTPAADEVYDVVVETEEDIAALRARRMIEGGK